VIPRLILLGVGLISGAAGPLLGVVVSTEVGLPASTAFASGLLAQPGYAATGWVEITEGSARYRGTGVLIADNWVLTAAHNWDAQALTALTFHLGGSSYRAAADAWFQTPGWTASPEVGLAQGWDLALFRLSTSVSGVTPARVYSGGSELGVGVTFLGAGLAGTAATGPRSNPTPSFYAGTNVIDRVIAWDDGTFGSGGLLAWDFDDGSSRRNTLAGTSIADENGRFSPVSGATIHTQSSAPGLTAYEAASAAGDSGAPAFADFGHGAELIGLVSWGVNPSNPANLYGSGYGDITYLTRLSAHREWIYATIPEPAQSGATVALCLLGFALSRRRSPSRRLSPQ
jgi:hypothetical protein